MLVDHFRNLNWKVYTIRESATILLSSGARPGEFNEKQTRAFQSGIIKSMVNLEETIRQVAESEPGDGKVLILCDRGVYDASVYCEPNMFSDICQELSLSRADINGRYDCVVHLVTAANGAPDHYASAATGGDANNNDVREESLADAIALDGKTLAAYSHHPRLVVVDNSTDFNSKILRVVKSICRLTGVDLPSQSIRKRKWVVSYDNVVSPPSLRASGNGEAPSKRRKTVDASSVLADRLTTLGYKPSIAECEYTYLKCAPGVQQRLRKRVSSDGVEYTLTTRRKSAHSKMGYIEERRVVSRRAYTGMLLQREADTPTIRIQRVAFVCNQQYFTINIWKGDNPHKLPCLLESYADDNIHLELPSQEVLPIEHEVTHDPDFSMKNLARRSSSANLQSLK
jgi:hypothetical protein